MPHRKYSHDQLAEIIKTLVNGIDMHFRHPDDKDVERILKEISTATRRIFEPEEFKAERCPDTDDLFSPHNERRY